MLCVLLYPAYGTDADSAGAAYSSAAAYLFYPDMKTKSSEEIADIASSALQSANVQAETEKIAIAVVQTVLSDEVRCAKSALTYISSLVKISIFSPSL